MTCSIREVGCNLFPGHALIFSQPNDELVFPLNEARNVVSVCIFRFFGFRDARKMMFRRNACNHDWLRKFF
jgi:hypothetical protein